MMTIDFRAKHAESGEWLYGSGFTDFLNKDPQYLKGHALWIWSNYAWLPVDMETIGQFTGVFDRHQRKIYGGDRVYGHINDVEYFVDHGVFFNGDIVGEGENASSKPNSYGWSIIRTDCGNCKDGESLLHSNKFLEVVGTIHD